MTEMLQPRVCPPRTRRTHSTNRTTPTWRRDDSRSAEPVATGQPIITFHPGRPDEGSFFGPVISTIPAVKRLSAVGRGGVHAPAAAWPS